MSKLAAEASREDVFARAPQPAGVEASRRDTSTHLRDAKVRGRRLAQTNRGAMPKTPPHAVVQAASKARAAKVIRTSPNSEISSCEIPRFAFALGY